MNHGSVGRQFLTFGAGGVFFALPTYLRKPLLLKHFNEYTAKNVPSNHRTVGHLGLLVVFLGGVTAQQS